ncbi:MAG: 5'/3'-nucleotidase SurE [Rhodanobacteraceae bacterium]
MRVLLSNDDGVDAPGIRVLAERLAELGEVTVVAPDRDRSGASNSLTLDRPVRVARREDGCYRVTGTPTDCVHLGLSGLLETEPDIVISGINNSANLGDDVIYSGTVSAAMEGRFLGLPAIAVSLAGPGAHHDGQGKHFDSAARAVLSLTRRLLVDPLPADTILNVNVPDRDWRDIEGFEVTRLGRRHRSAPCVRQRDPYGRTVWWIGPAGDADDAGPGTDFDAVRRGFVSVTPIHVDLTRFQALEKVSNWIGALTAQMQGEQAA